MATERPGSDELADLIRGLASEVDDVLGSARWAIIVRRVDHVAELEAAAALRHSCSLAMSVVQAHERNDEMAGRILTRAIFETWLVGLFLHYCRGPAAERLAGARKASLERWQRTSDERDRLHEKRLKEIRQRNAKIAKANAGKEIWNSQHPDQPPKTLEPTLNEPNALKIELQLHRANDGLDGIAPTDLNYADLVGEIGELSAANGEEADAAVAYSYVYRGLSNVGAHPTLDVLDSYIDDRSGSAVFSRVGAVSGFRSLADANLTTAFLLPAHLGIKVLGRRGDDLPVAVSGFQRFEDALESGDDNVH